MNILVTGAAGFIGYHLSQRLLQSGNHVTGIDSINDYYDPLLKQARLNLLIGQEGFIFHHMNITDTELLIKLMQENQYTCVIHLAAQAGVRYSLEQPRAYIDSNINGFFSILEACRKVPVDHLVYASSSSVYGNSSKVPFKEEQKTDKPVSLYAATKSSNELLAQTYSHLYNIPATGLRFFTVYGPWGRPDMAYFSFTKAIDEGKEIEVYNYGDLQRDFTYIDDITSAIEKLIPLAPKQHVIYNIGNNRPVELNRFIEILEKLLGKKAIKKLSPMQPGDVYATYADISKLNQKIGFNPSTHIEEGLQHFISWYQSCKKQSYQPM